MKNNLETSGSETDKDYKKWADNLEKMSDLEVSREVFNRIMTHSDIDEKSKEILKYAYDYSIKLVMQNKPLEPNLLKIYLQDLKGIEISQINMMTLTMLLGFCGITFKK